jgi:hypothetical protein
MKKLLFDKKIFINNRNNHRIIQFQIYVNCNIYTLINDNGK